MASSHPGIVNHLKEELERLQRTAVQPTNDLRIQKPIQSTGATFGRTGKMNTNKTAINVTKVDALGHDTCIQ